MRDRGDTRPKPPRGGEIPDVFTLTSLEQLKVIADPLRVRLLQAFCDGPRTTKQVADSFGEKPTRLYHHVDSLERVGLIRLVETRQVRGTFEKYYSAVAKRFRTDPSLFRDAQVAAHEALGETVDVLLDSAAAELRALTRAGCDLATGEQGLVSFLEVRGGAEFVSQLKDKLFALLEELDDSGDGADSAPDQRRYRLLLAYYPLDRTSPPEREPER